MRSHNHKSSASRWVLLGLALCVLAGTGGPDARGATRVQLKQKGQITVFRVHPLGCCKRKLQVEA